MKIVIQPGPAEAAEYAARIVADEIRSRPRAVLGLATGRTMEAVYARLVQWHHRAGLDFSSCRTFNLDEYLGLPASDVNSYRHYMNEHLFRQVNIDLRQTRLPDGVATDPAAECERYECLIADAGGVDCQLLGIGQSGHIGFNEPGSDFNSRTRIVELSPVTLRQNAAWFGGIAAVPRCAITMGIGNILESRRCVLLATGHAKANIIAAALEGVVTTDVPATALRLHSDCVAVLDAAAAARLNQSQPRQPAEVLSGKA